MNNTLLKPPSTNSEYKRRLRVKIQSRIDRYTTDLIYYESRGFVEAAKRCSMRIKQLEGFKLSLR